MTADPSGAALLRASSPSYTPSRRDIGGLLDLYLADESAEVVVARALLRAPGETLRTVVERLPLAVGATRARLVRLLARLYAAAGGRAECDLLLHVLAGPDEQSVRQAAHALGKSPPALFSEAERALQARLQTAGEPATVRAIVASLGKVGGPAALATLRERQREVRSQKAPVDAELLRLLNEAVQRLTRDEVRVQAAAVGGGLLLDVAPPAPLLLGLRCRAGLAEALADELYKRTLVPPTSPLTRDESDSIGEPSEVRLRWSAPLEKLFESRLWSELALVVAVPPNAGPATALSSEALIAEVAQAVSRPAVLAALQSLTRGPLRYRIHFASGGHRRALVKELGQAIAQRAPLLVNDPQDSLWQLEIDDRGPLRLAFSPRRLPDPRFSYRRGDVPAASHPTVAAALSWVARLRAGEVIWDPFVGSGTELVEAARLCPSARLYGSDLDPRALRVAQENLGAAGVLERVQLKEASALERAPADVTLILTNPPMGRRVRIDDTADLLSRFVSAAGRMLPTAGRLVWLTPQPLITERRARLAGLGLRYAQRIDMNGFWARLEVWEKEPA